MLTAATAPVDEEGQADDDGDKSPVALVDTTRISPHALIRQQLIKTTLPLVMVGVFGTVEDFFRIKFISELGSDALAVDALQGITFGFLLASETGFLNSATMMMAQSFGKGKKEEVGQTAQQGWILGAALSIPTMGVLWFVEPILNLFGQDPKLTAMVSPFARAVAFASPAIYWTVIDTAFLNAISKQYALVPLFFSSAAFGIGMSYYLLPEVGIVGSGYTILAQAWLRWAALKGYFLLGDFKDYGLFKVRFQGLSHLKKMATYGSPIAALSLGDQIRYFVTGMMNGWLGSEQLAINQSANLYLRFLTPPILGIRQASQILIAQYKGRNDYQNVRRFGKMGIYMEMGINTIPLFAYSLFSMQLATYIVPKQELEGLESFVRWVFITKAISRMLESASIPLSENLKGLLDTCFPSIVQLISSLAVILPLSYVFGFVFDWELTGLNVAVGVGAAVNIPSLLWRWCKLTYPAESANSQESNARLSLSKDGIIPDSDAIIHETEAKKFVAYGLNEENYVTTAHPIAVTDNEPSLPISPASRLLTLSSTSEREAKRATYAPIDPSPSMLSAYAYKSMRNRKHSSSDLDPIPPTSSSSNQRFRRLTQICTIS
ncbi:MAG TPA: MATE family efflux transporter [Gammaproteobacteria bacterium]|nr:MATE family efflux transporter [Gammaproteobacteria bacterium]